MRPVLFLIITLLLISACAAQPPPSTGSVTQPSTSPAAPITPSATLLPPTATGTPGTPGASGTHAIPLQPTTTRFSPLATLPQAITPLPLDAAPPELVAEATSRLAGKLGLETSAISLFSVTAVEWPDASLGCPIGGQRYAPVITPGYQIQLQAGEEIYSFHTDMGSQIRLCSVEPPHEIYQPP